MTVIAFRAGVMAADSMWSDETVMGMLPPTQPKIRRTHGGRGVFGFAGTWGWSPTLLRVLERKDKIEDIVGARELMKAAEGADWVILFAMDGLLLYASSANPPHTITEPFAVGSGADLAIGAMDMGATAVEAARIAANRSKSCGGKIVSLEIDGWKRSSSKKVSAKGL